jgi:hypothetical protein
MSEAHFAVEDATDFVNSFIKENPRAMIIKYARRPNVEVVNTIWGEVPIMVNNWRGAPYGVVVAIKHEGDIYIGWSRSSPRDKFNKKVGLRLAIERASKNVRIDEVHEDMRDWVTRMADRAARYYQRETPIEIS